MQVAFVLGCGGATDSYKIQLLVVKLSSAGPRKIIRPSIYHHTHYGLIRNMFTRD